MKKHVLFVATLLALGTAFVSCSKDEVVNNNTGVETPVAEGEQEIILNLNSTGDGLTSRGGRPLYSSAPGQEIDRIVIKIIDRSGSSDTKDQVVRSITINNWQEVSKQYTVGGNGRMYAFKLTKNQKVPAGTYEIYAIGYTSSGSLYNFGTFESNVNVTFNYSDATQKLEGTEAEEVFAGSIKSITVDADGNFVLTNDNPENNVLTLHRQVAGVIGYYSNIPVLASNVELDTYKGYENYNEYVMGLKLRLVSSNANSNLIFAGFNSEFTETGEDYKFVVNGYNSLDKNAKFAATTGDDDDANTLYEIKLGDWFISGDVNQDGMLDINDNRDDEGNRLDNWISPYSSIENLEFEEGSVFAGKFVIPFQKIKNSSKTLELQLVATVGLNDGTGEVEGYKANSIIRSWTINLSSTDPQVKGPDDAGVHVRIVDETSGELKVMETDLEELANSYSIVRNHLYTVGTKGTNDYDPDTDEPQDLSKGQELVLKVNDNWELIHKMEIE